MKIPEILLPLIARNVVEPEGLLEPWRDSFILQFMDGAETTVEYLPDPEYLYICYGMSMSPPRDINTGDSLTTDDYGLFIRHSQIRYHWSPAVESAYMVPIGEWIEITTGTPLYLYFYNNSGLSVIQDFTLWMMECKVNKWPVVSHYLKGLFRQRYALGHLTLEGAKHYIDSTFEMVLLLRELVELNRQQMATQGIRTSEPVTRPSPGEMDMPWWEEEFIDGKPWWKR